MPTSAHGITERALPPAYRGFTLIELLVVLVVAGIVLGAAVVQLMPDDRSQLRDEAEQLALLLENAGLEARSSGVAMAWLPEKKGYQFWLKNEQGNWKPVEEGPFRFRAWGEDTRVAAVLIDHAPLKFGERMLLSASSFALPFEIHLEHGIARATVTGGGTTAVAAQMEEDRNAARPAP